MFYYLSKDGSFKEMVRQVIFKEPNRSEEPWKYIAAFSHHVLEIKM